MTNSRACKCCTIPFLATDVHLEFCSPLCIETDFKSRQTELLAHKDSQISALSSLVSACVVCGSPVQALTKRKTPKHYCSASCTLRGMSPTQSTVRPCVHCDVDVTVLANLRPDFVRCDKHRMLWPKIQLASTRNMKKMKVADAPFDQYFFKGPWWDHKKRAWTVLLMHSGASSRREIEFARYLLSVKSGKRLNDAAPIVYVDGDRTNVDVCNLALG